MKRSLFVLALAAVILLLPLAGFAQDKMATSVSYTGCFNKGDSADHYVLKDDASGKTIVVTGDAKMLAVHANNHKVTITGTMTKENNADVLKATDLKMLARCQ